MEVFLVFLFVCLLKWGMLVSKVNSGILYAIIMKIEKILKKFY